MSKVYLGTELKLNISIAPIDGFTMDEYDFNVDVYCSTSRVLSFAKKEAIRLDENNYVVCVDTFQIGAGSLKCKVTAQIPDGDFPDDKRTEVTIIDTDITIAKSL